MSEKRPYQATFESREDLPEVLVMVRSNGTSWAVWDKSLDEVVDTLAEHVRASGGAPFEVVEAVIVTRATVSPHAHVERVVWVEPDPDEAAEKGSSPSEASR